MSEHKIGQVTLVESAMFNGVAIGKEARVTGKNAIAIGTRARADGNYSIALGTDAHATKDYELVIGNIDGMDLASLTTAKNLTYDSMLFIDIMLRALLELRESVNSNANK